VHDGRRAPFANAEQPADLAERLKCEQTEHTAPQQELTLTQSRRPGRYLVDAPLTKALDPAGLECFEPFPRFVRIIGRG
jgi:hypothetical protein